MRASMHSPKRKAGFTLVELLVALMVMALLALMSWRGLDGMARATEQTRQRADALMTLQTGLAQWGADLDAMVEPSPANQTSGTAGGPGAIDWNGLVLRITRTDASGAEAGLRVVAWSRRDVQGTTQWLRWQSGVLRDRAALQSAWSQAAVWAQNPGDAERQSEVAISPLLQWQVFYFRNDAWTNPLSSAAAAAPDGVRLELTLPPGDALAGTLRRDWIRPTVGGNKS